MTVKRNNEGGHRNSHISHNACPRTLFTITRSIVQHNINQDTNNENLNGNMVVGLLLEKSQSTNCGKRKSCNWFTPLEYPNNRSICDRGWTCLTKHYAIKINTLGLQLGLSYHSGFLIHHPLPYIVVRSYVTVGYTHIN